MKEREQEFMGRISLINGGEDGILNKMQLLDFLSYWTESNPSGRKMRFEMEKTWDDVRRLKRWKRNPELWANQRRQNSVQKSFNLDML